MNAKAMEAADLGEMPSASHATGSAPSSADMPSGAMQPGDTMTAAGASPAAPEALSDMPGEPGPNGGAGDSAIGDMPAGTMADAASVMAGAAPAALLVEMPAGPMETTTGLPSVQGFAAADGSVMELSGQWRMSFWVTPKS